MAYSGKYKPKNPAKYTGDSSKVVYRSLWERHCFKWCDNNPQVLKWSSEEVVIPYLWDVDKRYHRYFVDLKIKFNNNETWLIEIKPDKQTRQPVYQGRKTKRYISESMDYVKNQNKWKAAERFAKERGWKFVVWTENTLERMGIKPKSTKPLKPYVKRKK